MSLVNCPPSPASCLAYFLSYDSIYVEASRGYETAAEEDMWKKFLIQETLNLLMCEAPIKKNQLKLFRVGLFINVFILKPLEAIRPQQKKT